MLVAVPVICPHLLTVAIRVYDLCSAFCIEFTSNDRHVTTGPQCCKVTDQNLKDETRNGACAVEIREKSNNTYTIDSFSKSLYGTEDKQMKD